MKEWARELGEDPSVDLPDCCARVALAAMELVEGSRMVLTMPAEEVAKSMSRSCVESAGCATTDLSPMSSAPTSHSIAKPCCTDAASLCNRNFLQQKLPEGKGKD